jgi:tetratricopeptide (TPR) repeat protein
MKYKVLLILMLSVFFLEDPVSAFGEKPQMDPSQLPKTAKGTPIFDNCIGQFNYTTMLNTRMRQEPKNPPSRNVVIASFEDYDELCVKTEKSEKDQILTSDYWLAQFYSQDQKSVWALEKTQRFLSQNQDFNGQRPEMELLEINLLQQTGQLVTANTLLQTFINAGRANKSQLMQAYNLLSVIQEKNKDWPAAIETQKKMQGLSPTATAYRMALIKEAYFWSYLNKPQEALKILQTEYQRAQKNGEKMDEGVNLIIKLELERLTPKKSLKR